MRFQEISNRIGKIDLDTAVDTIRQNCSAALSLALNNKFIWRGIQASFFSSFLFGDSTKGDARRSANTNNYYTLLIDNSPYWANYPKRSRSFICSVSIASAESYGNRYAVFPYDGTKIGVCPDIDIWISFRDTFKLMGYTSTDVDLESFNTSINYTIKAANAINSEKINFVGDRDIESYRVYLEFIRQTIVNNNIHTGEQLMNTANINVGYGIWLNKFIQSPYVKKENGLFEWLTTMFRPEANGFNLCDISQVASYATSDNEVWFSGKAVFVYENECKLLMDTIGAHNAT